MEIGNQFSEVASLLGEKCRSIMLWHLLDGRACTPTELSHFADISAQSASNHLSLLVDANILSVERQGRHRYYRFANAEVAQVIESMASLIHLSTENKRPILEIKGISYARTCYDHLAGTLGVAITDSLVQNGMIRNYKKGYVVTEIGFDWFQSLGIKPADLKSQKRSFARACLDWTERRYHLAGALGASLLQHMLKNDWVRRIRHSREILVTSKGKKELQKLLGLVMPPS